MLSFILQQSPVLQALIIFLHGLTVLGISILFIQWQQKHSSLLTRHTPVPTFFVSVSSVFALLLAFHVSSIWARQHDAQKAFIQNQAAVQRFNQYTGEDILKLPKLNQQLREFVALTVEKEWIQANNREANQEVEVLLKSMRDSVVRLSGTLAAPVHSHLFKLLDDLSRSRTEILWIGGHQNDGKAWFVILILGLLSSLSIAAVHFERPEAGITALVLFALATSVAYWSILDAENPFKDRVLFNPETLLTVLNKQYPINTDVGLVVKQYQ